MSDTVERTSAPWVSVCSSRGVKSPGGRTFDLLPEQVEGGRGVHLSVRVRELEGRVLYVGKADILDRRAIDVLLCSVGARVDAEPIESPKIFESDWK